MRTEKHPDLPYYRQGLMSLREAAFHLEIKEEEVLALNLPVEEVTQSLFGTDIRWYRKEVVHKAWRYVVIRKTNQGKKNYFSLEDVRKE